MKRQHTQNFCSRYGNHQREKAVKMAVFLHPTMWWGCSCECGIEIQLFTVYEDAIEFIWDHQKTEHAKDVIDLAIQH